MSTKSRPSDYFPFNFQTLLYLQWRHSAVTARCLLKMAVSVNDYQSTVDTNVDISKRPSSKTRGDDDNEPQTSSGADDFTLEDAVTQIGFGKFHILISLPIGIMYMADSMEFVVASILGPELSCEWRLSSREQALISIFIFIGLILGGPALGRLADVHGRKASIVFGAIWSLYFGILSAWAPNLSWLLILRCLYGFGIGNTFQTVTYYAEFLPQKNRGKHLALMNTWWACGTFVEVVLAIFVLLNTNWNWWLLSSALPLLLLLPSLLWLPESPRYDIASGRTDRALATLQTLAKMNKAALPSGRLLPEGHKPRGKFRDLFKTRDQSRVTILCCLIWAIGALLYYGYILMSSSFLTSEQCTSGTVSENEKAPCDLECQKLNLNDYLAMLWTSVGEVPAGLLTALIIDIIGRKWVIILDSALLALVGFILCMCPGRTAMVVLLFFARAGAASLTLTMILFIPEANATHIRAVALGTATACSKVASALSPVVAQLLWSEAPRWSLALFTGLGVTSTVAAALLPFDTTQRAMS